MLLFGLLLVYFSQEPSYACWTVVSINTYVRLAYHPLLRVWSLTALLRASRLIHPPPHHSVVVDTVVHKRHGASQLAVYGGPCVLDPSFWLVKGALPTGSAVLALCQTPTLRLTRSLTEMLDKISAWYINCTINVIDGSGSDLVDSSNPFPIRVRVVTKDSLLLLTLLITGCGGGGIVFYCGTVKV